MAPPITLFDTTALASLQREFRSSMRGLLFDLCDELEGRYRRAAKEWQLPLGYFRFLGEALEPDDYSGWKTVGWIEELNDLVYFTDLLEQLRRERQPAAFARDLFAECQEKFYENSYRDELFPSGLPRAAGLARRLAGLCAKLAGQVTQESLWLIPGLPCAWLAGRPHRQRLRPWIVACDLGPNFERAEWPGRIAVGLDGTYLEPPSGLCRRLAEAKRAAFLISPQGMTLRVDGRTVSVLTYDRECRWHWRLVTPCLLQPPGRSWPWGLTLGPTLVYRKDLSPWRLAETDRSLARPIQGAAEIITEAWPEGARLLGLLTSRIVPLKARGVVSFSYRHRPGLSFINTFERDAFDLIDDLVHENSHHHLNLLLRKYDMRRGDRNQEVFYSPWRRSLRPLHGILHATFTFTMGAVLFDRLAAWGERGKGRVGRKGGETTFTPDQVLRARFRCLEEVESVGYSIRDLSHAADRLGWLSPSGVALVKALAGRIALVRRRSEAFRSQVLRSRYGPALRRHIRTLEQARATYGFPGP